MVLRLQIDDFPKMSDVTAAKLKSYEKEQSDFHGYIHVQLSPTIHSKFDKGLQEFLAALLLSGLRQAARWG